MTVLEAESLSVTAADGTSILEDVDLAVDAGETVLVCGGPGAGKTILLKALKGLLDERTDLAVAGTVRRNGTVGFVFQRPGVQLVRQHVRDDVAFGLENRGVAVATIRERIDTYAALLEAEDLLERRVRDLSRGEEAKAALLGCLVTDPDVVVLDEPLSALDHPNTRLVLEAIDRLRDRGTAVVVSEHDLRDLLPRGDRVVLLADGAVDDRGRPRELASALRAAGVKLPVVTEVALERGASGSDVPVSTDD